MVKKILLPAICLASSVLGFAGDGEYAVSKISPVLIKNADVVIRLSDIYFEFISPRQAKQKEHYVITIMNENGDDWAQFEESYDKLREIASVEGYLYDANGKELKKMKFKDLQDLSGVSESLMEDNRIKRHNFYYRVYPYTIEYEVEFRYNYTLFFPRWFPRFDEKLSVELSRFTIECPTDYQFRYKAFNYEGQPEVTMGKHTRITTWSAKNLPAIIQEQYAPYWHEFNISVITGPTEFQVGDYKGNMNSWQDFGKFVYALKMGRDNLPDNLKMQIHQLTDGVTDARKKIQLLYTMLQKNTRYISIQLGIGGWQPFDASYVAKKGYGDCKALTNYMYSILKEAGINSFYTLIRAGEGANYMDDDFPSSQFNHVILFVPLGKDTVWLECTSQILPAGYLSGFTSDRYALAVDENGGRLVRTPRYGLKENSQYRTVKAKLADNGELSASIKTNYAGIQQDDVRDMINYLAKDKLKEYLSRKLDFATYEINKFDYSESGSSLPAINESLEITASNYATITGKRLFIIPNVMNRTHTKWKTDEERKYDIVLRYEYVDVDSVEIEIPAGYTTESIPQPVSIQSKYGKYLNSIKLDGNKIYYYRYREQYNGTFPAKEYAEIVNFFESIYKADRNKIVFVKK